MKKILLLCMMLLTAVLSASAFTVYVADDYTGKVGETFISTKFLTAGSSDNLMYTVTYEVNKEATGTTESTAALITIKSIAFEGSYRNTTKDIEFPAFFSIEKRNGTKVGYGRVNMLGYRLFNLNTTLETVTLNFNERPIFYIGIDQEAFDGCKNLKHVYVTNNASELLMPTFDALGSNAFTDTESFADPVKISVPEGNMFSHYAFKNSAIPSAEIYTAKIPGGTVFKNCPNLKTVTASGSCSPYGGDYLAEDCPNLTNIIWKGSSAEYSKVELTPFYNLRDQVTQLTIQGSVPAHMFEGFSKIAIINSPSDLCYGKTITIGEKAFANCENLVLAAVGGNMDQSAFENCTKLETLIWRGGFSWGTETPSASKSPLHSIGAQLKILRIEGDNADVADYLCAGMKQLFYVQITQLLNGQVGAHAFEGCIKLETVDMSNASGKLIENGNQYWIHESAFAGCTALKNFYNLPLTTRYIDDKAFYNCKALTTCPITQKHTALRQLGSEVFAGSGINELVVPVGVTNTGNLLVNDCPNLKEIYFLPNTTSASNFGGSWAELFAKADSKTRKNIKNIYLNYNLTSIPEEMFMDYTELVNQYGVMPSETNPRYLASMDKVTTIQSSAFKNCVSLENCAALKSKALAQIYPSAFEDSNIKTSFAEMDNLTIIWNEAFKNCPNIERFGADKIDGADAVLPKLQTISADAFNGCYNLKSVHLPANLKTISTDAFAGCPVETVLFGVTSYNYSDPLDNAGIDKTQIKVFEIGDNVTVIPAALAKGAPLKTVKIGYNIKSVGAEAFADCSQLKEVTINTNLENMPTNYNLLNPSIAPFARSAVEKASFGPAASVAGRCILAGTPNLKEVVLNKVTTFNDYSFAATGLEEITFNNAQEIKANAFKDNKSLKTINIAGTAPTTVSSSAFDGCSVQTINTTCDNSAAISGNKTWTAVCSNIVNPDNKFQIPADNPASYQGQGTMKITKGLDCSGKFTVEATPLNGYIFISWVDGNTENPRTVDLNEYTLGSLYPIFDNPSLYTEEIKLNITPENAGEVKVYNEHTEAEITDGKYKRDGSFVFVPQATSADSWYEFKNWQYDENKQATKFSADDPQYPNGLGIEMTYTVGDNEIPNFPEEITAVFEPKDIQVEVRYCLNGNGNIQIEGDPKLGNEITLTAVPDKGYKFSHWGNDENATSASTKVVLSLENIFKAGLNPEEQGTPVLENGQLQPYEESALYYVELCATFVEDNSEMLTVTVEYDESIVEIEGRLSYVWGEEVSITAKLKDPEHYHFEAWIWDKMFSDELTLNFIITKNTTVKLDVRANFYTITTYASPAEGGEVLGAGSWPYGQPSKVIAKPNEGYVFDGWEDDPTAPAERDIMITGDATYTAKFRTSGVGVDNITEDKETVRKVVIDGMIYVIKDEKMYNLLGVEVK